MATRTSVSLDDARAMIDRGLAHAAELGVEVSIAVVDASGNLVAVARMDDALFVSTDIAVGKAWTSAAFRAPSGAVAESLASAPAFASAVSTATSGRFTPRQGAVPLPDGGAVGASGASSAQDEDIARHAADDIR